MAILIENFRVTSCQKTAAIGSDIGLVDRVVNPMDKIKRRIQNLLSKIYIKSEKQSNQHPSDEMKHQIWKIEISVKIFRWCSAVLIALGVVFLYRHIKELYYTIRDKNVISLNGVKKKTFSIMEPLVAIAMVSTFSVIYRRFKDSLLTKLNNYEKDLLLYNTVQGLTHAFIRSKGKVPTEAIHIAMRDLNTYIKVHCKQIDEYIKLLQVTGYNPRNGEEVTSKVLIPAHDDLADYDSFEVTLLDEPKLELVEEMNLPQQEKDIQK